jgi:hypothetical protein
MDPGSGSSGLPKFNRRAVLPVRPKQTAYYIAI